MAEDRNDAPEAAASAGPGAALPAGFSATPGWAGSGLGGSAPASPGPRRPQPKPKRGGGGALTLVVLLAIVAAAAGGYLVLRNRGGEGTDADRGGRSAGPSSQPREADPASGFSWSPPPGLKRTVTKDLTMDHPVGAGGLAAVPYAVYEYRNVQEHRISVVVFPRSTPPATTIEVLNTPSFLAPPGSEVTDTGAVTVAGKPGTLFTTHIEGVNLGAFSRGDSLTAAAAVDGAYVAVVSDSYDEADPQRAEFDQLVASIRHG